MNLRAGIDDLRRRYEGRVEEAENIRGNAVAEAELKLNERLRVIGQEAEGKLSDIADRAAVLTRAVSMQVAAARATAISAFEKEIRSAEKLCAQTVGQAIGERAEQVSALIRAERGTIGVTEEGHTNDG